MWSGWTASDVIAADTCHMVASSFFDDRSSTFLTKDGLMSPQVREECFLSVLLSSVTGIAATIFASGHDSTSNVEGLGKRSAFLTESDRGETLLDRSHRLSDCTAQ